MMSTSSTSIARVETWRVAIPYRAPMRSSRGRLDAGEKVLLRLTTVDGACGLGEASIIFPGRSGESAASVFARIRDVYAPWLLGQDAFATTRILHGLSVFSSEQHAFLASLCAVDLALHDLKARLLGVPVAGLLGGAWRSTFPLSRSISILPHPELVEAAQSLADQGYRLITLKGSSDWRADIGQFEAVRRSLPDAVRLEIDPNQAWAPKAALEVDRALGDFGLVCIEQPCAWWDLEGMRFVTERARTPIAADESVLSPADAMQVIRTRAADMITIKLAKSGGIRNSAAIVEIAAAAGLQCNMGSKHAFGVGTAALLHFAAAYPAVGEFIGYGSAAERFVGDVICERIDVENACVRLPAGDGFGVTLDEAALREFAVEAHELDIA